MLSDCVLIPWDHIPGPTQLERGESHHSPDHFLTSAVGLMIGTTSLLVLGRVRGAGKHGALGFGQEPVSLCFIESSEPKQFPVIIAYHQPLVVLPL